MTVPELKKQMFAMLTEIGLAPQNEYEGMKIHAVLDTHPEYPLDWIAPLRDRLVEMGVTSTDTIARYIDRSAAQNIRPGDKPGQSKADDWTDEQWDRYWQRTTEKARIFADAHVARQAADDLGPLQLKCLAEPHETECEFVKIADDLETKYA